MSRNVEAMAALLVQHFGFDADEFSRRNRAYALADWLASQGILAVDSLTDEQAALLADPYGHDPAGPIAEDFRAALRRCAPGEPPHE